MPTRTHIDLLTIHCCTSHDLMDGLHCCNRMYGHEQVHARCLFLVLTYYAITLLANTSIKCVGYSSIVGLASGAWLLCEGVVQSNRLVEPWFMPMITACICTILGYLSPWVCPSSKILGPDTCSSIPVPKSTIFWNKRCYCVIFFLFPM